MRLPLAWRCINALRAWLEQDDRLLVTHWKEAYGPERLEYRAGCGWVPCAPVVGDGSTARSRGPLSALPALSILALGGWTLPRLLDVCRRRRVAPGHLNLRLVRGAKRQRAA